MIGAVEVGDGVGQRRAEQEGTGQLLGTLVDSAGRVHVPRAERLHEGLEVEEPGEVVHIRVAQVDGHGVTAVLLDDRRQPALDLGKRLVPRRRVQLAVVAPDHGRAQTVRILVQVLERGALGTDVALAPRILTVAADATDGAVVLELDLQGAGRLTQWARPVVERHVSNARATSLAFSRSSCSPVMRSLHRNDSAMRTRT